MMSIRMSGVRRRRFQFRGVKLRKIATKGERKGRFVTGKEGGAYSLPIASVSLVEKSHRPEWQFASEGGFNVICKNEGVFHS